MGGGGGYLYPRAQFQILNYLKIELSKYYTLSSLLAITTPKRQCFQSSFTNILKATFGPHTKIFKQKIMSIFHVDKAEYITTLNKGYVAIHQARIRLRKTQYVGQAKLSSITVMIYCQEYLGQFFVSIILFWL